MNPGDTSIGGAGRAFPDTTMGLLAGLSGSAADPRPALDEVCRRYWKPVYGYLRMARSKSNEDAKDLTQAFLLWLVEGEALSTYAAERGSLRHFIKMLLGRFGENQERALHRLKRGGGVRTLRIDDDDAPLKETLPDGRALDPGQLFDREWRNELARGVIDRVRARFAADGRSAQVRVYEEYHAGADLSYEALASKLGLREPEVRYALSAVREAVRLELRAELARFTATAQDLEDEFNALFGS